MDNILLACNDIGLFHKTKQLLSKTFNMKDLGDASFVIGIEIRRDRSRNLLDSLRKPILIVYSVGLICRIVEVEMHLW